MAFFKWEGHANTHDAVEKGECIIEGQESKAQNQHSNQSLCI